MANEAVRLKALLHGYVEGIGGQIEDVSPGIVRVELPQDAAAEFEGGPWALWRNPTANESTHISYYFTFDPLIASERSDVEWIAPGSHRFEQIAASIRRLTGAFRAWLPASRCIDRMRWHPQKIAYRPFLLFLFRINLRGKGKEVRPFPVAVDRVDQLALTHLARVLPGMPLRRGRPQDEGIPLEPAIASFDVAFATAFDELLSHLENETHNWADEARKAVEAERERLEQFYMERDGEDDRIDVERRQRLGELDALLPRARVDVVSVGDVSLPVAYDDRGGLHHLAFHLF